jgi:hypothetical protein
MNKQIDDIYQQVIDEDCDDPLYRFAELVRQDEREACAALCEDLSNKWYDEGGSASDCAAAIRARGQK